MAPVIRGNQTLINESLSLFSRARNASINVVQSRWRQSGQQRTDGFKAARRQPSQRGMKRRKGEERERRAYLNYQSDLPGTTTTGSQGPYLIEQTLWNVVVYSLMALPVRPSGARSFYTDGGIDWLRRRKHERDGPEAKEKEKQPDPHK